MTRGAQACAVAWVATLLALGAAASDALRIAQLKC